MLFDLWNQVCVSAVCGLRFNDFRLVGFFMQAKISIDMICFRQSD